MRVTREQSWLDDGALRNWDCSGAISSRTESIRIIEMQTNSANASSPPLMDDRYYQYWVYSRSASCSTDFLYTSL
ncbi:hypothetical protein OUZ56_006826 [Daphnia magna]|uniref:Uncharacterized protein n=1 Tax=Daphnia magna TaxID=35525 RepID=A0ABQ9YWS7_9CRUS|nr:hypothetical protein OUZ56_006826 [Daphnia magna]